MTLATEGACWFHLKFDLPRASWNYVMAETMWMSTLPVTHELLAASSTREARRGLRRRMRLRRSLPWPDRDHPKSLRDRFSQSGGFSNEGHAMSTVISQMRQTPAVTGAALTIDDEVTEPALLSLNRLRSAVVELSTALNEALRDERGSAAAYLQRARAMLTSAEGMSPPPSESDVQRPGLAPWQVRRVLAHIEVNLATPIRNKDLAAIVRLSEYHFNVAFRRSVGDSPHEYIIRRRMERSQGLMLSTEKSLSEIALECGLADKAHFSRLFRRIVGDTPAAWRRARANPS